MEGSLIENGTGELSRVLVKVLYLDLGIMSTYICKTSGAVQ